MSDNPFTSLLFVMDLSGCGREGEFHRGTLSRTAVNLQIGINQRRGILHAEESDVDGSELVIDDAPGIETDAVVLYLYGNGLALGTEPEADTRGLGMLAGVRQCFLNNAEGGSLFSRGKSGQHTIYFKPAVDAFFLKDGCHLVYRRDKPQLFQGEGTQVGYNTAEFFDASLERSLDIGKLVPQAVRVGLRQKTAAGLNAIESAYHPLGNSIMDFD